MQGVRVCHDHVVDVYVETGVGGHIDDAAQAWTFDLSNWGRCGQGIDEDSALESLRRQLGLEHWSPQIKERLQGDELAFTRDRLPAQEVERECTKRILRETRPQTMALLVSCTPAQLDWIDPDRELPHWATWDTLRRMGWHVVDTEMRYYLAKLGYGAPRSDDDLLVELRSSTGTVERIIDDLPSDLIVEQEGEVWTTAKVLRRLAWHERSELEAMKALVKRAKQATVG